MAHLDALTGRQLQDIQSRTTVVIIVLGATEYHGPHLPLGTDTFIPSEIARRAAEKEEAIVVIVPFGNSWAHRSRKGTIRLHPRTLSSLLHDICFSLRSHGFLDQIFLVGHIDNESVAYEVAQDLIDTDSRTVPVITSWGFLAKSTIFNIIDEPQSFISMEHAGEVETSLMLAIKSKYVDKSAYVSEKIAFPEYPSPRLVRVTQAVSETGVLGDPTKATEEKGKSILDSAVKELANIIQQLKARRALGEKVKHA